MTEQPDGFDRLLGAIRATKGGRYADLVLEVGRVGEDRGFPADWAPAGRGAADLTAGSVAIEWTGGGQTYFLYFQGDSRIVASEALAEWPGPVPAPHGPRHPADPLWFIVTLDEALRLSTADVTEVQTGPRKMDCSRRSGSDSGRSGN